MTFIKRIKKFIKDSKGATAIEYALIAGLISVAAIVAMQNLGTEVKNTFAKVEAELNTAQKTN